MGVQILREGCEVSKIELGPLPDWLEEFDNICHTYRVWPATDPAGTRARFDELVSYVRSYAEQEVARERERCAKVCESIAAQYRDDSHGHAAERSANAIRKGTEA